MLSTGAPLARRPSRLGSRGDHDPSVTSFPQGSWHAAARGRRSPIALSGLAPSANHAAVCDSARTRPLKSEELVGRNLARGGCGVFSNQLPSLRLNRPSSPLSLPIGWLLSFVLIAFAISPTPAHAQQPLPVTELGSLAPLGTPFPNGYSPESSVGVDDDLLVVGRPAFPSHAAIHERDGSGRWTPRAIVNAPNSVTAVAVDGRRIVLRIAETSLGRLRVYEEVGGAWTQVAQVDPQVVGSNAPQFGISNFGSSIDLSGDTLVVGSSGLLAASIYERDSAGSWILRSVVPMPTVVPSWPESTTRVEIEGDTIVIANGDTYPTVQNFGSVLLGYVESWRRTAAGGWARTGMWTAPPNPNGQRPTGFGSWIDFDGSRLAVCVRSNGPSLPMAYVYTPTESGPWQLDGQLVPAGNIFWSSSLEDVALEGETVVVSSRYQFPNGAGTAFRFVRSGAGVWSPQGTFVPSNRFGASVFAASAALEDGVYSAVSSVGRVHQFHVALRDGDGDGVLDSDTDRDGLPDSDDIDDDGDGTVDIDDLCPLDRATIAPGICGCAQADLDTDGDGTLDCFDGCPFDPLKTEAGFCGCGVDDAADLDGDGSLDCLDADDDGDGVSDNEDVCPRDPLKTDDPGHCGCGVVEVDSDGDMVPDCQDECPADPLKTWAGQCGCGVEEIDTDQDGYPDCIDGCPRDPNSYEPGPCGCGEPWDDSDSDGDGAPDCVDGCPQDPQRIDSGPCGCEIPLRGDSDGDGLDGCIDEDDDGDGVPDAADGCPDDAAKTAPGLCGCGFSDTSDLDQDGIVDCLDPDADDDGVANADDGCPLDPQRTSPGACGCGSSVAANADTDGDGVSDCVDGCPNDPGKVAPGLCGCGFADIDSDANGMLDCEEPLQPLVGRLGRARGSTARMMQVCGDMLVVSLGSNDCWRRGSDGRWQALPTPPLGAPNQRFAPTDTGLFRSDGREFAWDGSAWAEVASPDALTSATLLSPTFPIEVADSRAAISHFSTVLLLRRDSGGTWRIDGSVSPLSGFSSVSSASYSVIGLDDQSLVIGISTAPSGSILRLACYELRAEGPFLAQVIDAPPDRLITRAAMRDGLLAVAEYGGRVRCWRRNAGPAGTWSHAGAFEVGTTETPTVAALAVSGSTVACEMLAPLDPSIASELAIYRADSLSAWRQTFRGRVLGRGALATDGAFIFRAIGARVDIYPADPLDCELDGIEDADSDGDGVSDCLDGCPMNATKTFAGTCGCDAPEDIDVDGDLAFGCDDGCPNDPLKIEAGICGCGLPDSDTDGDGTANCFDQDIDGDGIPNQSESCPNDPLKTEAGICGCGVPDTDTDGDGTADCFDQDIDGDGIPNESDECPAIVNVDTDDDGVPNCIDTDDDGDGWPDSTDGCPLDRLKVQPGVCGCGTSDTDVDGDGTEDCVDGCPNDPGKVAPGTCGCGVPDGDRDGDGVADCNDADDDGDGTADDLDACPHDPAKTAPGACGCGVADTDTDGDAVVDCIDGCPNDPAKSSPGACGCGVPDSPTGDSDSDGVIDCLDGCPNDPSKTSAGTCGCGQPDIDGPDGDGVPSCIDPDDDGDGVLDVEDGCPDDPMKAAPGICGCGVAEIDTDGDGAIDCLDADDDGDGVNDAQDGCPLDAGKSSPGACGCGIAEFDFDADRVPDCIDWDDDNDGSPDDSDGCPRDPLKTDPGDCGCGVVDTDVDQDGASDCRELGRVHLIASLAPATVSGSKAGAAVALDKGVLAIGSPWEPVSSGFSGRVRIYRQSAAGAWELEATLQAPTVNFSRFGALLELSGDTLAVQCENPRTVFVYTRQPSGWTLISSIIPPVTTSGYGVGEPRSMALDGARLALGNASSSSNGFVRAWMYGAEEPGGWALGLAISGPAWPPIPSGRSAVSLDGDTVCAADGNRIRLFDRNIDGAWIPRASMPETTDGPFRAILQGDRVAALGYGLQIWRYDGVAWSVEEESEALPLSGFGVGSGVVWPFDFDGRHVAVRVVHGYPSYEAAIRFFERNGDAWNDDIILRPRAQQSEDFGAAIAVSQGIAAVGSPSRVVDGLSRGGVDIFRIAGVDLDGDGVEDPDADFDGLPDAQDIDDDNDGTLDANDGCPFDPLKSEPGACGCGVPESGDADGDGIADCNDADDDNDGADDASDGCPLDPLKTVPGACGCGVVETGDLDGDGAADCVDDDDDDDGILDGIDNCPGHANTDQLDCDGDGIGNVCDGFVDCDGDGLNDRCEWYLPLMVTRTQAPFGSGADFVLNDNIPSDMRVLSNVSITLRASANLAGVARYALLSLDGGPAILVFDGDEGDCAEATDSIVVPRDHWNALAADGFVHLSVIASPLVDAQACGGASWISVEVSSDDGILRVADCNGNLVADACEAGSSFPDCDRNGFDDRCQVSYGIGTDANANGVLDSCEAELVVGDGGYPSVAAALAVAFDGMTITVRPGVYGPVDLGGRRVRLRADPQQPGAIIDAAGAAHALIVPGYSGSGSGLEAVVIEGLVLRGASARGVELVAGPVEMYGCTVASNLGGGIAVRGAATLALEQSIVADNAASFGGGVLCEGAMWLAGCEFRWNVAPAGSAIGIADGATSEIGSTDVCSSDAEPVAGTFLDLGGNRIAGDCDVNGVCDLDDLDAGAADVDGDTILDRCEPDCNGNAVPDDADIVGSTSADVDGNGVPDECQADCNGNEIPDKLELTEGAPDVDANGVLDACQPDCDEDALPDTWELATGLDADCNGNARIDRCEIDAGKSEDCNANDVPDGCDIAAGEADEDVDGRPDACQFALGDFDLSGEVGAEDLAFLLSSWALVHPPLGDLDGNGVVGGGDLAVLLSNWGPT